MKLSLLQFCLALLFTGLSYAHDSNAQEVLDREVSLQLKEQNLEDALSKIEESANVKFIFSSKLIKSSRFVSLNVKQQKLSTVLEELLKPLNIGFKVNGNKIILNRQSAPTTLNEVIIIPNVVENPITGKVTSKNGEGIPGASVSIKGTKRGVVSDAEGNFKINADKGEILVFSFIGFKTAEIRVGDNNNLNVNLEESASALSEVAVVGSRSTTARTNINTPAPVDVISTKELKSFPQVEIGQILNYVAPSFSSNRQTISDGSDHIDPASLRGLTQVLVLVNGKRRHMSSLVNINGSVGRGSVPTDLSAIPVSAIERIEVLRDGAAAQYGSDAIAGVINVVLKKNYEGLSASITGGTNMTTMNYNAPNINGGIDNKTQKITDGGLFQFDLSKSLRLGKGGNLTLSGQYATRGRTNRSGEDNVPTEYLGTSGGFPATPSGQVTADFRNTLLKNDAALVAKNGYDRHNMIIGNSSSVNASVFANGSIPVGKKSEVYFTGGLSYKNGKSFGNARIPVSRSQQPLLADGTSLLYPNGFLPGIESNINDHSLSAGFKTKLNDKWNFDVSNTFGGNNFAYTIFNSGNATLRTGQTEFDAGTLKFMQNTSNIDFSRNYPKAGSSNYVNLAFGGEFRIDNFQIVAGETASYSPISGASVIVPTAPLTEGGPAQGTTAALPGSQVFPGYQPGNAINKSRNSQSLYADVETEMGKLLMDVAGRFENYSDFGSTVNGKIASRLQIIDGLALRGAASTGFRAPTLQERYFNSTSTQFISGLPANTLTVNNDNPIARDIIGVAALKPEKSVNLSLGLTTRIAKQLTLTVDAYQITIKDRIVYSGGFSAGQLGLNDAKYNNAYAGISSVKFFANAADTRTRGIDVVASEKLDVGKGKLTLSVALNFNETKVTAIKGTEKIDLASNNDPATNPSTWFRTQLFDRNQVALLENYLPKDKWNLSANYAIGKFNINVRAVRFGEVSYKNATDPNAKKADGTYWNTVYWHGTDGKQDNTIIDQTFAPVWITDIVAAYQINKMLSVSVGANNIFDVYPQQINIDPRNAIGSIDYSSGRDNSNRGRQLYQPNQGGYNGRYVFGRLNFSF
ncbi:TonB-dependent receptor domain-containing protein [Emticicia sp. SJ17W-69]|uniref:TonB-dependent receptor domain-containing protein n=1 Tax=Emticicia sp. SJ17W-69 TaxID=3421657 RepID=UPI003EB98126